MRPYIVNSVWDGFTMVDDGSGRFHAWLDRERCPIPPDGLRRTVLAGSMEKEARRMAAEGHWGEEVRLAELGRQARRAGFRGRVK
jgi:hypothetical protein